MEFRDWLDVSALDTLEAVFRARFNRFPADLSPNETQTKDELVWPVLARLGWPAHLRQQNLSTVGSLPPEPLEAKPTESEFQHDRDLTEERSLADTNRVARRASDTLSRAFRDIRRRRVAIMVRAVDDGVKPRAA